MPADHDAVLQAGRSYLAAEARALATVPAQLDASFSRVADIVTHIRGKVVTSAVGTSGAVAARMAHLLSVCGTPSVFLHPTEALHGSLGFFHDGDVLIALSKNGETDEVTQLCTKVRQRGVPVVVLTARPDTTLAGLADVLVLVDAGDADPGGLVSMSSSLAAAAWGDALAAVTMRMRGHTYEAVIDGHPGGSVGKATVPDETVGWR